MNHNDLFDKNNVIVSMHAWSCEDLIHAFYFMESMEPDGWRQLFWLKCLLTIQLRLMSIYFSII